MINYLLIAGIAIGLGLLIGKGTHLLKITGVVGYIITGIIIGPEILGIVELTPIEIETMTNLALGFVAFIIGEKYNSYNTWGIYRCIYIGFSWCLSIYS